MSSYSQIPTDVAGLGSVIAVPEYTSPEVSDAYREYLNNIITILNLSPPTDANGNVTGPMPAVTQEQADAMLDSINQLLALAQSGKPDANGVVTYLTIPMANDLNVLIQSLQALGIDVTNGVASGSLTQIQLWKDLAAQSPLIQNLMESMVVSGDTGSNSLQALVELVYVRQGNQVIGEGLDNLQSALNITKNALDILAQLQNVHNTIEIVGKSTFNTALLYAGVPTDNSKDKGALRDQFGSKAQQIISAFFNPPIVPGTGFMSTNLVSVFIPAHMSTNIIGFPVSVPDRTSTQYVTSVGLALISAQKTLVNLRNSLSTQLELLRQQTPASVLNDPVKLAGSPYGQLQIVYNDLKNTLVYTSGNVTVPITATTPKEKAFAGIQAWMLDNYDQYASSDSSNAGKFQQDIVNASTALSSLNTTQTEQVRNYLFVFEEFYKSASAVLQALTQMIQKMASNISK